MNLFLDTNTIPCLLHSRMFRYSHLPWVQAFHLYIKTSDNKEVLKEAIMATGSVSCLMAAIGIELGIPWTFPAVVSTILFALRFLSTMSAYTDRNYLFLLLMVLTILSGGGNMLNEGTVWQMSTPKTTRSAEQLMKQRRRCEVFAVLLRAQFAIMFFFLTLWRIHPDWMDGSIMRSILLSPERKAMTWLDRMIPWTRIGNAFPSISSFIAFCLLLGDVYLCYEFMTANIQRPPWMEQHIVCYFVWFRAATLSSEVGYTLWCAILVAGTALCTPFKIVPHSADSMVTEPERKGSSVMSVTKAEATGTVTDMSVPSWLRTYWTGNLPATVSENCRAHFCLPTKLQRIFALVWVVTQLAIPLRMPLASRGKFAYTGQAQRWSWGIKGLHWRRAVIFHKLESQETGITLRLAYIVPTCFADTDNMMTDFFMERQSYINIPSNLAQDTRTLPMEFLILNRRNRFTMEVYFGSLLAPVAGGIARKFDDLQIESCLSAGSSKPEIGMHATYFAQLNEKGAYSRLVDPTVNLADTDIAQRERGVLSKLWGVFIDKVPPGHDFLLRHGVGSFRSEAQALENDLQQRFPGKGIYLIADRAACLQARPLWLRPMRHLTKIVALKTPQGRGLVVKAQEVPVDFDEDNVDEDDVDEDDGDEDDGDEEDFDEDDWAALEWSITILHPSEGSLSDGPTMKSEDSFQTFALEIGIEGTDTKSGPLCRDTLEEDVLFALVL